MLVSLLLLLAVVMFTCTAFHRLSNRLGVPALLAFLFLGMLFGSDGLFKIPFEDYAFADQVSTVALLFIMFYGGFGTNWRAARPAAAPAILLSSLGTVLTAALTGLFCHFVVGMPLLEGLLCGAVLSLLSAGCYDDAGTPATTIETPPATTTLAELRRLYAGRTVRIESDIFVRGRVVTSDRAGNFYRTLVLEEQGAAAELMAGIDGLHNVYPEGCELTVGLRELALGESYGVLQIGRLPV